ncbi:MAG: DUF2911 domain-containing protein [Saprospiraceae bacterium]|nr:DUF2911 domain-containing protein [Saprospiraceae bacterium]MBP9210836.1 DUF2911 domain-containing protein [Saprospiraceae bacterium]
MKKILIFLGALAVLPLFGQISVPAPSPLCKLEQKVGLGSITIEYSRPGMKNRNIFSDVNPLVPYGKMWRTGANAATRVSFSEDVKLEGRPVPKGTYALFTVPGKEMWEIILYSDANVSGVPQDYDRTKEVVRVSVEPHTLVAYTFETFFIDINDIKNESATMNLVWESTLVPVRLSFDVDSKVMANIDKVIAGPSSNDYYQAARYYYDANKDMARAQEWAHRANELAPTFWKLRLESLILASLGRKPEAIEAAQRSKAMAAEAGNDEYVKMNDLSIQEWSN